MNTMKNLYLEIKMKHRLNLDIKDSNYTLLEEIFKIMDFRKTFEILALKKKTYLRKTN